jgi:hypothetical protein
MAAVIVVAMLDGCSFAFVRPSPRPLPAAEADGKSGWTHCHGYGVAAADLLGAPLAGVIALQASVDRALDPSPDEKAGNEAKYVAIGILVLSGASLIYGLAATQVCMDRLEPKRAGRRW